MLRIVTTSLMLLGIFQMSFAQHILRGVVAEEDEKGGLSPLIGVNVLWLGTTDGTVTDENGVFELECSHEDHLLVISYVGYASDTVQIDNHEELTIVLKNAKELEGVEITYRKKSTEVSFIDPIKTQVISQGELFKAACCNLSESFETNPSVDVSFTDAVTGTRQITMLGLAGSYTQITQGNMPLVRGLAANSGLTFVPGSWISSIQLMKGTGSVVNGFESVAGQINVELKNVPDEELFFLNGYANQEGRFELNTNFTQKINAKWSTTTLLHGNVKPFKQDGNDDGFMDFPTGYGVNVLNRWQFASQKGIESQFGIRYLKKDQVGGQMSYDKDTDKFTTNAYGVGIKSQRIEGWGKLGFVFPEKRYKSIGLQLSGSWQDHDAYFGFRNHVATQYTLYSNLIYQSVIRTTNHKFKTGVSYLHDNYDERLDSLSFDRTEIVPGAFFEYTFTHLDKVTLVAGIRADYNNLYGFFPTPRVHTRFALSEKSVLRLSAGRGQRTANIIAENMGVLASSRAVIINPENGKAGYGLNPEIAWNYGINFTQNFRLAYRDGLVSIDFYRTDFQDQVVVDLDHSTSEVLFYNLDGKSYSNSFQVQVDYEVIKHLDVRLAYRWYDVKTDYRNGLLSRPLISAHRAFINLAYETKRKWKFDYTLQWQGEKRIPFTQTNPENYRLNAQSPHYFLMNAQITKAWKKGFELYVGMENIANYKQENPILSAEDPFADYFDSSMIWGPIFGRNAYIGFRYTIKHED